MAELIEENPKTAQTVWDALPIEGMTNTWGDEIYFRIPVSVDEEHPQQEVDVGDLAYWPLGNGFCIFFGQTPASTGTKPRAASPVNVFGRVLGDSTLFTRWDEVERAWEIFDPLLSAWKATPGPFPNYSAGTWGPVASDELLARDGREWRRP